MVLPTPMRLRGHRCFDHLHRNGHRNHGTHMVLRLAKARESLLKQPSSQLEKHQPESRRCRCAVVISGKVSKRAVVRNRLRRQLHAHLRVRLGEQSCLACHWLLLSLKPGAAEASTLLLEECDSLLQDAGLLP